MRSASPALLALCCVLAAASLARAQDAIEALLRQPSISAQDRAKIETEVTQRVDRLQRAGDDESRRASARARLHDAIQSGRASPDGAAIYAAVVASRLGPIVDGEAFLPALDAAIVLARIPHPSITPALISALGSPHPAVRLKAARAIQPLRPQIARNAGLTADVLRALGRAGANETNELVLREVYRALDFPGAVNDFADAQACADALIQILESRAGRLEAGSRDASFDRTGVPVAAACYSGADAGSQARLVDLVHRLLAMAADRYFADDTAPEYRPTLEAHIRDAEAALFSMMQASNVAPPTQRVSAQLAGDITDAKKQAAQAALAEIGTRLAGDPWNLS